MSVGLLEPAELAGMTGPGGDPETLRAAAQVLTTAKDGAQARQAELRAVVAAAVPADWDGPAATAFREEAQALTTLFTTAIDACGRAVVALERYAEALAQAQAAAGVALDAGAELAARANRWEQQWADGAPPDLSADEATRLRATQAQDFQAEAAVLAGRVAAANEMAQAAAEQARRDFLEITGLAEQASASGNLLPGGLLTAATSVGLAASVRDLDVARRAPGLLPAVKTVAEDYKWFMANGLGEKAWRAHTAARFPRSSAFLIQGVAETFGRGRQSLDAAALAANDAAGRLRPLSRFAGRVLGPPMVAMDLATVFTGAGLEGGWDVADRVVAGAGAVAGGLATAAAFGLFTLSPPGFVAVTVVLAASAAWNIGKWAYQNREEIAEFMVDQWDKATEAVEDVGNAVRDGFQKFGAWLTG